MRTINIAVILFSVFAFAISAFSYKSSRDTLRYAEQIHKETTDKFGQLEVDLKVMYYDQLTYNSNEIRREEASRFLSHESVTSRPSPIPTNPIDAQIIFGVEGERSNMQAVTNPELMHWELVGGKVWRLKKGAYTTMYAPFGFKAECTQQNNSVTTTFGPRFASGTTCEVSYTGDYKIVGPLLHTRQVADAFGYFEENSSKQTAWFPCAGEPYGYCWQYTLSVPTQFYVPVGVKLTGLGENDHPVNVLGVREKIMAYTATVRIPAP